VLYWGLRLEDGSSETRDPERLAANELRFRKLLLRYAELPLHGGAGGGLVGGDWANGKLPKVTTAISTMIMQYCISDVCRCTSCLLAGHIQRGASSAHTV
jgi:hypothetical protein